MFEPVNRNNEKLSEKLVEQINHRIILGELKPGDKLPSEKELGEMFQVSRTTVREAILALVTHGILQVHRGKGIFVEQFNMNHFLHKTYPIILSSTDDFEDVIHVRRLIESECARLAANNATNQDIDKMSQIVIRSAAIDQSDENAFEKLSEANSQFHRAIAKSCGSKVLLHIIQPLWSIIDRTRQITLTAPERKLESVHEHTNILEAIRARDAQRAHSEMEHHLQEVSKSNFFSK